MRRYLLDADNKPCIWPVPNTCIWNGRRFNIKGEIKLYAQSCFEQETRLFLGNLESNGCSVVLTSMPDSDIRITCVKDENLGLEGYLLDVDETGVNLKANTSSGIFYGCQTLLQLIVNSPDPSIHGVNIKDYPVRPNRGVLLTLKGEEDMELIKKFIDFLSRYKFNVVVTSPEALSSYHMDRVRSVRAEIMKYSSDRHIEILEEENKGSEEYFAKWSNVKRGTIVNIRDHTMIAADTCEILKSACRMWWNGLKEQDNRNGCLLPDYLEYAVAQLYPVERDNLLGMKRPSRSSTSFEAVELRKYYNFPLVKWAGFDDDYNYLYMINAKSLPNTVPFSMFQGVLDYRLDNSLVQADNRWSRGGVYGICIGKKLKGMAFLHSYTVNLNHNDVSDCGDRQEKAVGNYIIHYEDGSCEEVPVIYGKTICSQQAMSDGSSGAYYSNPVFIGVTDYKMPYAIYAQEWINNRPHLQIKKIDIIPEEGIKAGGIVVFGITCIL